MINQMVAQFTQTMNALKKMSAKGRVVSATTTTILKSDITFSLQKAIEIFFR
jgi:hypothetical protein